MRRRGGGTRQYYDTDHDIYDPKDHDAPYLKWSLSGDKRLRIIVLAVAIFGCTMVLLGSKLQQQSDPDSSEPDHRSPHYFFPKYGSREFAQRCRWAVSDLNSSNNSTCTIMLRAPPHSNEGIAEWLSMTAVAFTAAKQTGCSFLLDYLDNVEIHEVVRPASVNWTIPSGFECSTSMRCLEGIFMVGVHADKLPRIARQLGVKKLVQVPNYRHAYLDLHGPFPNPNMFPDLHRELPSYDFESGMACALQSVFELAPSATQFQPDLFTKLLPKLRDPNALVISIYYRSGYADDAAKAEMEGKDTSELIPIHRRPAQRFVNCALALEQQHLVSRSVDNRTPNKVVWMVVTDSSDVKDSIRKEYESAIEGHHPTPIRREILTTTAQGTHTRAKRNPSTVEFAQAFIDWYLIGESDLVVMNSKFYSFGATAALRTARRVYESAGNCTELPCVENPSLAVVANSSRSATST